MWPVILIPAALLVAQPAPSPFAVPTAAECWVEPLSVSLGELAMMNRIADQFVRSHCQRWVKGDFGHFGPRPMAIASTRLGHIGLFGEQLSFGFDVVVRPGALGAHDDLYATPVIDLPDTWERAIDRATYPALAIAGTAVITAIILQALK